jgi:hypothetical protein
MRNTKMHRKTTPTVIGPRRGKKKAACPCIFKEIKIEKKDKVVLVLN